MKSKHGFYTTEIRSALMKKIRSQDTKPELALRKALWALGYRYRINSKKLPGKPDIVLNRYGLVVFVDGEFWHGYQWETKKPKIKANRAYWVKKIEGNMARDKANVKELKAMGYTVLRFWEHEIRKAPQKCLDQIVRVIEKG